MGTHHIKVLGAALAAAAFSLAAFGAEEAEGGLPQQSQQTAAAEHTSGAKTAAAGQQPRSPFGAPAGAQRATERSGEKSGQAQRRTASLQTAKTIYNVGL